MVGQPAAQARARTSPRPSLSTTLLKGCLRWLPPLAILVSLISLWEIAMLILNPAQYLLPWPHDVFATWIHSISLLSGYGLHTVRTAIVGAAIGGGIAFAVGAAVAPFSWVAQPCLAYSAMLQATPTIVLTPLAAVWYGGPGTAARTTIVAVAVFPMMFMSTVRGLSMTPPELERLMLSYAASRTKTFLAIRLPAALPSIISGVKVVVTTAMIVAIVAELFGGPTDSLGAYMRQEAAFFRSREVWAGALTAVIFGLILYAAAALLERLLLRWDPSVRAASAASN